MFLVDRILNCLSVCSCVFSLIVVRFICSMSFSSFLGGGDDKYHLPGDDRTEFQKTKYLI